MPTFNAYVDASGYYISARPSDIGNVTYQIEPTAEDFVCELGYDDQDELPWGIVTPMRAAGLVYTNNQGVSKELAEVPELDPTKLAEMSNSEASKLLTYLQERGDISENVVDRVRSRIGDQETFTESDPLDILGPKAGDDKSEKELPVKIKNNIVDAANGEIDNGLVADVDVEWPSGDCVRRIHITVDTFRDQEVPEIIHKIVIREGSCIDEWAVEHPFEDTWVGLAKAYETKLSLMRVFEKANEKSPIDIKIGHDENGQINI